MYFFPNLCAFNINWNENTNKLKNIKSHIVDLNTGHKKAILTNGQVSEFYAVMTPEDRFEKCTELLK
jgi:hypothetical protein